MRKKVLSTTLIACTSLVLCGCWDTNKTSDPIIANYDLKSVEPEPFDLKDELDFSGPINLGISEEIEETTEEAEALVDVSGEIDQSDGNTSNKDIKDGEEIGLDKSWKGSKYSVINSGKAKMYKGKEPRKNYVVAVNAGHGCSGGDSKRTQTHPWGGGKLTGGTTASGETTSIAISSGMTFNNGTTEAEANLKVALKVKDKLLAAGYDVLMIRETSDQQLDNVARTVVANNNADCHVSIHFDSTDGNRGAFMCNPVNNPEYRAHEPVKSMFDSHVAFGQSFIDGLRAVGVKITDSGKHDSDLTQLSYSQIPTIAMELGGKGADISDSSIDKYANGLKQGVDNFFSSPYKNKRTSKMEEK